MVESQPDKRAKAKAQSRTGIADSGPKRGRTCYVQRADRIKIKVEVGFGISATVDVSMKNLVLNGDRDEADKIKSCLVVLIGGHGVVVSQVEEARSGVYPVRLFTRCRGYPENLDTIEFGGKTWVDVGDYITMLKATGRLDPETVKRDIASWKG